IELSGRETDAGALDGQRVTHGTPDDFGRAEHEASLLIRANPDTRRRQRAIESLHQLVVRDAGLDEHGRWRGPHAVDREREHFLVARLQRAQVQSGYREALLGGLGRTVGELRIQAAARRGKAIAPGSVEALQPGVQWVQRGRVANRESVADLAVKAAQLPG